MQLAGGRQDPCELKPVSFVKPSARRTTSGLRERAGRQRPSRRPAPVDRGQRVREGHDGDRHLRRVRRPVGSRAPPGRRQQRPPRPVGPRHAHPGARDRAAPEGPLRRRQHEHDTTSILLDVERPYGLAPLGTRDAAVNDLATSSTRTARSTLRPRPRARHGRPLLTVERAAPRGGAAHLLGPDEAHALVHRSSVGAEAARAFSAPTGEQSRGARPRRRAAPCSAPGSASSSSTTASADVLLELPVARAVVARLDRRDRLAGRDRHDLDQVRDPRPSRPGRSAPRGPSRSRRVLNFLRIVSGGSTIRTCPAACRRRRHLPLGLLQVLDPRAGLGDRPSGTTNVSPKRELNRSAMSRGARGAGAGRRRSGRRRPGRAGCRRPSAPGR